MDKMIMVLKHNPFHNPFLPILRILHNDDEIIRRLIFILTVPTIVNQANLTIILKDLI